MPPCPIFTFNYKSGESKMRCAFCRNNDIAYERNISNEEYIVSCNACKGKYYIRGESKHLIKYPKGTIIPFLIIPCIFLILFFENSLQIDNIFINNIFILMKLVVYNLFHITMMMCFLGGIFKFYNKGYIINFGEIITKDDSLSNVRYAMIINSIVGFIMLITLIYFNTNTSIIKIITNLF